MAEARGGAAEAASADLGLGHDVGHVGAQLLVGVAPVLQVRVPDGTRDGERTGDPLQRRLAAATPAPAIPAAATADDLATDFLELRLLL